MNRRIAGVITGVAMFAGIAAMSTATAGMAAADGGRSSEDSSIFTVNYGSPVGDGRDFGREFSARDQTARDQ